MDSEDFSIVKIGNRRYWRWPDGTLRAVISGGADGSDEDDDDDDAEDEGDEDDDTEAKKKKGKLFTQQQVNVVATREKRDGKKAGRRELLEELGFESVDELKEAVEAAKSGKAKDDADTVKERKKLEKEKADALAEREAAKKDRHDAKVERRLMAAGVPLKKLEKVARLIDVELGAEADEIDDAIDSIKEDFPELFGSSSDKSADDDDDDDSGKGTEARKGKNPDSTPGRKAGGQKAKSPADRAKERLAQRHPELVKNN